MNILNKVLHKFNAVPIKIIIAFFLRAEKGAKYCSLHQEPTPLISIYTVIDILGHLLQNIL